MKKDLEDKEPFQHHFPPFNTINWTKDVNVPSKPIVDFCKTYKHIYDKIDLKNRNVPVNNIMQHTVEKT